MTLDPALSKLIRFRSHLHALENIEKQTASEITQVSDIRQRESMPNVEVSEWNKKTSPDSKFHGANMGPILGRQDPGGPHVDPIKFAIWVYSM